MNYGFYLRSAFVQGIMRVGHSLSSTILAMYYNYNHCYFSPLHQFKQFIANVISDTSSPQLCSLREQEESHDNVKV